MNHPRRTTRADYMAGTFALLLIGIIGAAADLYASLRSRLGRAVSHNAPPAAIDPFEIR